MNDPQAAIATLNLPDHLTSFLDMNLRVIGNTHGRLRDSNESRAQGAVDALRFAKVINRAEAEHLQRIIAATAQHAREAQEGVPAVIEPSVMVDGDELVIRIGTDALLHAVTMSDHWPVDYKGESLATITDRALFVQEIADELQRGNEQGATPVHLLFDEAAEAAMEAGTLAVEVRDEDDDE